jgi:hypothetical protein
MGFCAAIIISFGVMIPCGNLHPLPPTLRHLRGLGAHLPGVQTLQGQE